MRGQTLFIQKSSIEEVRWMDQHKKQVLIEKETTAVTVAPITIKINSEDNPEELKKHLLHRLRKQSSDLFSTQGC